MASEGWGGLGKVEEGREMIDGIIPFNILTECDHTSGFYGIGRKAVADRVSKSAETRDLLAS